MIDGGGRYNSSSTSSYMKSSRNYRGVNFNLGFFKSSRFLRVLYNSFARLGPNEILRHRGSGMLLTCSSNTSHARLKRPFISSSFSFLMYVSVAFQGQTQSNAALLSRQYIFLILLLAVEERGKLSMNTIIYMSRVRAPHHTTQ